MMLSASAQRDPDFAEEPDLEYRAWAPKIARWVLRLGGPFIEVEDTVQDVFVKALRNRNRFRGDAALSTWLYRITFNEVMQMRRRRRLLRFVKWLPGLEERVPAGASLVDWAERREDVLRLHRALERLDEKFRTVIVLYELEGKSGEEIAQLMGAKVQTVWVWLSRARAKLLAEIGECP